MGLFYEEFSVGEKFETPTHEITRDEIAAFARLSHDDNPLHTDVEYARAAGFPDVLAHGPYLQALSMGLIAETGIMAGTTIALLAISARFKRAVFPGDEVRVCVRISRKRPTSSPDRGLLWRRAEIVNQHDVVAVSLAMTALVKRRG